MTLRQQQSAFTRHVAELIRYVYDDLGHELTFGEVARTKEQQALYIQQGKSQTMNSKHLTRLAVDLNLFKHGVYQQSWTAYKELGDYWCSLDSHNVWGGNWTTLRDAVHFERNI